MQKGKPEIEDTGPGDRLKVDTNQDVLPLTRLCSIREDELISPSACDTVLTKPSVVTLRSTRSPNEPAIISTTTYSRYLALHCVLSLNIRPAGNCFFFFTIGFVR